MIIWINGSFGVGKTSVAELLKNKIDHSIIYDPEGIGGFLSDLFNHEKSDFQDYELCRTLNANILQNLSSIYETIIIPMTITNLNYYNEIIKGLENSGTEIKHFILSATKENIINRLDSRKNSTAWSYKQVDRCIKSFEKNEFGAKIINTDNMTIEDVSTIIIDSLTQIESKLAKEVEV